MLSGADTRCLKNYGSFPVHSSNTSVSPSFRLFPEWIGSAAVGGGWKEKARETIFVLKTFGLATPGPGSSTSADLMFSGCCFRQDVYKIRRVYLYQKNVVAELMIPEDLPPWRFDGAGRVIAPRAGGHPPGGIREVHALAEAVGRRVDTGR